MSPTRSARVAVATAVITAIVVAGATAGGSARVAADDTLLPRKGGTTSEQVIATRMCPGDDQYLSGMRGGTSWDVLRTFVNGIVRGGGVVNGVRTVGISCRRLLDLGDASGSADVGEVAGFP